MTQIIGGMASGIKLNVPAGNSVRPSLASSRKALFDSIGPLNSMYFVDVFAGSGAMGLEAASRGAKKVLFIEKSAKFADGINSNIEKVRKAGVDSEMLVVTSDILDMAGRLESMGSPDFVFCDPPYAESADYFRRIIDDAKFAKCFGKSILIWEFPNEKGFKFPLLSSEFWKLVKKRNFGGAEFVFMRCN